jgi:hypothetical protein
MLGGGRAWPCRCEAHGHGFCSMIQHESSGVVSPIADVSSRIGQSRIRQSPVDARAGAPLSSKDRIHEASQLLDAFAERTGIDARDGNGRERLTRRYLWTDAFAVSGFVTLWRETGERRHMERAVCLVDGVHQVLGRHRPDEPRQGWLSGLGEEQGKYHPTLGGLRIGKPAPERAIGERFDERSEWDRDGQYFHYLSRWMHALDQVSRYTRHSHFNLWARELAQVAHRAFVYRAQGHGRRMYWKMSIDLSRPLVLAMGQHDPLEGLVTSTELQATAASFQSPQIGPSLNEPVRDFSSMLEGHDLTTADALGLGGLLIDARRVFDLMKIGAFSHGVLLDSLLVAAERGLTAYAWHSDLAKPAAQRLAFRELGLAIGLGALDGMLKNMWSVLEDRAHGPTLRARLNALAPRRVLGTALEGFWLEPRHRRTVSWAQHQDINDVMLAASLLPDACSLP